jgi:hypothetical protein
MSNVTTICPRVNSKSNDGHTMSKIEVKNELAKQERDLLQTYKGYPASCCKCGEKYEISINKYTLEDKINLSQWLTDGNCPFCLNWKTDRFHKIRNDLVPFTFDVNGREILALRVPNGFRPKKITKLDDKGEAVRKKNDPIVY